MSEYSATELLCQRSIPAVRMVVILDIETGWKLYVKQLENYTSSPMVLAIREQYQSLSENAILQIIGHELAHWLEWFFTN